MDKYNQTRKQRLQSSLNIDDGREPIYTVKKHKNEWFWYIVYGVVISLLLLFHSNFMIAKVDGASMDNTLKSGQRLLVNKKDTVERFDIVVLNEREEENGPAKKIIKRVIGMPGDVVTYINGILYINNQKVQEPYLTDENITNFKTVSFTITVPENHYFVLGDNRDVSKDSRQVGSFVDKAVIGVAIVKGQ